MKLYLLYYDIVCYMFATCVFMICFIYFMLFWASSKGGSISFDSENQTLELCWTVVPTMMILFLGMLNVKFITNDLNLYSDNTLKVIGHQWYWSYSCDGMSYDSYVNPDGFSVDKPIHLMRGLTYHFMVTSADVIHSFHMPSLSLKMDAMPGRLNHLYYCPDLCGSFVGYCAELCGVNHSVMPIVMEVTG